MKLSKQSLILKEIRGGRYSASPRGHIISFCDRHGGLSHSGRALKSRASRNGYDLLTVYSSGKKITVLVHQMVWLATNGGYPPGNQINHIDGNKRNNRPDNLEVVTPGENQAHAYKNGLASQKGESNNAALLSFDEVRHMRFLRAHGAHVNYLAKKFGVTRSNVYYILQNKTWRSVC